MSKKINEENIIIQNNNNLKYVPIENIDNFVIDQIKEKFIVNQSEMYNSFISNLNAFLYLAGLKLDKKTSFNHSKYNKILVSFQSYLNSPINPLNISKTQLARYNRLFDFFNLPIIDEIYTLNFDQLKDKIIYLNGYVIKSKKKNIILDLYKINKSFGRQYTENILIMTNRYIEQKSERSLNMTLLNKFFNFLAENKTPVINKDDFIKFMVSYFEDVEKRYLNMSVAKMEWARFVRSIIYIFDIPEFSEFLIKQDALTNMHVKIKNGKHLKTKLITEIPLEICDQEAIQILIDKINQDINNISKWANYTINYHYNKFKNINDSMKVKDSYYNKTVKEIATIKFGKYDKINIEHLYDKDSYFNANIMYAICLKLIENHPEITLSFLENCTYLDKNDNVAGVINSDAGQYLVSYKKRRGFKNAEQKILLNEDSSKLLGILIEMTESIRNCLKNNGDERYKDLFINASNNNLTVKSLVEQDFKSGLNRDPFKNIYEYLLVETKDNTYSELIASNTTLTKFRASRGVQIYLETESSSKMAEALGHIKYDPQLLKHYLPEPILEFFQRRWILLFQKGIICESLKNSDLLFKASGFKTMEQLDLFLKNHVLKDVPSKKQENVDLMDQGKIYISINEDNLSALFSIKQAIDNSTHSSKVSNKAIYWKQFIEHLTTEIINNNTYKGFISVLNQAERKANPDLFKEVIYV